MRAVVVRSHGAPEVLAVEDRPSPRPGPGQVRVTTELTSVNFADVHGRRGGYDAGGALPFTPGLDCVGVVDAVGEGVTDLAPGRLRRGRSAPPTSSTTGRRTSPKRSARSRATGPTSSSTRSARR